jgi:hypothetical protein
MNLTVHVLMLVLMLIIKLFTFVPKKDIIDSHSSSISNFTVRVDEKELKLPITYWIPKYINIHISSLVLVVQVIFYFIV